MIPMQIMIGQLTGQPLPVHQIEPTRIYTFNEHGNSISLECLRQGLKQTELNLSSRLNACAKTCESTTGTACLRGTP